MNLECFLHFNKMIDLKKFLGNNDTIKIDGFSIVIEVRNFIRFKNLCQTANCFNSSTSKPQIELSKNRILQIRFDIAITKEFEYNIQVNTKMPDDDFSEIIMRGLDLST